MVRVSGTYFHIVAEPTHGKGQWNLFPHCSEPTHGKGQWNLFPHCSGAYSW